MSKTFILHCFPFRLFICHFSTLSMRVEKKPTVQLGMVKKKHRLRKQQKDANEFPDSSDEGGIEGKLNRTCENLSY